MLRGFNAFLLIGFVVALLAACSAPPPKPTPPPPLKERVSLYGPDWGAATNWTTASYTIADGCVGYKVDNEPTGTMFYACGNVLLGNDAPLKNEGQAPYVVNLLDVNGRIVKQFDAKEYSVSGGCIKYTAPEDSGARYACGAVLAQPRSVEVSGASPAPLHVVMQKPDGSDALMFPASSATNSGGCIKFVLAGDVTSKERFICGNVRTVAGPRISLL